MTSLLSGERVPKTHPRVEACGDVDELTSLLGAVAAALPPGQEGLRDEIQAVQGDLLHLGAVLAATPGSPVGSRLRLPGQDRLEHLEARIATMDDGLPRLQGFILPGGHPSAAWAHVARTVCRRVERRVAALSDPASAAALPYLNRLSSWLFSLARWCNMLSGTADIPWKG